MAMDGYNFIGKEIGNYRITREINSGAYGSVYLAEHTHLKGRTASIKLLHTYLGSPRERAQFAQEAQFLAQLEHPHILPLLDFGFTDRQPYLIAQYAANGSLRDLLRWQRPLSLEKTISILTQIGQALHHAHQQQIIHRDLKPENILFSTPENALLADFGIATMLSTASIKHLSTIGGTPPYMAPEQFQGIISKEGDQYALGCIAYELLTGHQPFSAPDFLSLGFKHLTTLPEKLTQYNPHLPAAAEAAIIKALAKQRTERHADIPAFLAALQAPFVHTTVRETRALQAVNLPALTEPAPALPTRSKDQLLATGNDAYRLKNYAEALTAYEQAIRLDPNLAATYNSKGNTLHELKRNTEALTAFEQALHLDPNLAAAHNGKGHALSNLARYPEALTAFEQALRLDPHFVFAHHNKGNAHYSLAHYPEALAAYEQAIRLDSHFVLAYVGRGLALRALRRHAEALTAFEQAIRLDPTLPTAHHNRGHALYNLARYAEALTAFEQTIRLDPKMAFAHVGKGHALRALQRYPEALAAYEQAVFLEPNSADIHKDRGEALAVLGRDTEAQQAYEIAWQLRNKH